MLPMNKEILDLINEAILVEKNVADLYMLFHEQYPEDADFWWKISLEEQNHAALLKTARQMITNSVDVPGTLFPDAISELEKTNRDIRSAMEDFKKAPDRAGAFQTAYRIENSAGELHFDNFMKATSGSPVHGVFKKLNGADVDHAHRIRQYMAEQGIPFEEEEPS